MRFKAIQLVNGPLVIHSYLRNVNFIWRVYKLWNVIINVDKCDDNFHCALSKRSEESVNKICALLRKGSILIRSSFSFFCFLFRVWWLARSTVPLNFVFERSEEGKGRLTVNRFKPSLTRKDMSVHGDQKLSHAYGVSEISSLVLVHMFEIGPYSSFAARIAPDLDLALFSTDDCALKNSPARELNP